MSQFGYVATGHPFTTFIGEEILKKGGNAFDAAVGCALAANISEPLLTSLGGGGILIGKKSQELFAYDFFTNFPGLGKKTNIKKSHFQKITVEFSQALQSFYYGWGTVAVPGTLKGLLHTHTEHGQMTLHSLLAHVLPFTKKGVPLNKTQSHVLNLLLPIITSTDEGKALYTRHGQPLKEGDLFTNPQLGLFLQNLEQNCDNFYSGKSFHDLDSDYSSNTHLTLQDLQSYEVIQSRPLSFEFQNCQLYTSPPPAHGGHFLKLLFSFLEKRPLNEPKLNSVEHINAIAEILIQLEMGKSSQDFHSFTKGTTHISVCDTLGNGVSLSLTNGEGSGVFLPGSGVMLNNMLGEEDICDPDPRSWKAGHRLPSMMAPCLVQRPGHSNILIGSGGSKRIRSSLLQTLYNLIVLNLPLEKAITAPRVNWDGEKLQVEPGLPKETLVSLSKKYPLSLWSQLDFYFGGTHSVIENQEAFGDPRREGWGTRQK